MPTLPVAAFLAGALLSLLLPVGLLIALTVWYLLFLRRVPEPDLNPDPVGPPQSTPGAATTASAPAPEGS